MCGILCKRAEKYLIHVRKCFWQDKIACSVRKELQNSHIGSKRRWPRLCPTFQVFEDLIKIRNCMHTEIFGFSRKSCQGVSMFVQLNMPLILWAAGQTFVLWFRTTCTATTMKCSSHEGHDRLCAGTQRIFQQWQVYLIHVRNYNMCPVWFKDAPLVAR